MLTEPLEEGSCFLGAWGGGPTGLQGVSPLRAAAIDPPLLREDGCPWYVPILTAEERRYIGLVLTVPLLRDL